MKMMIEDLKQVTHAVTTADELEMVLRERYECDVNSFWLWPDGREFPKLLILVNADIAYLHYVPADGHAGFSSIGMPPNLQPGEWSAFYMGSMNEEQPIVNEAVVSFVDAAKAAREFFASAGMPRSIKWLEL